MGKSELKLKLHSLVDKINDEIILFNFYDAFSSLASGTENKEYQLTEKQDIRLAESLMQFKSGNVIDDIEVRREIVSWLEK